ncbi:hypothetical protein [Citrobacter sp. wls826]|uniref:hypothetical protein n=1 Tax=Citrobacter sp. wls826 TaxID=2576415 RepID=UPI0010C9A1E9|nr:hypothetical protein [Citrobacter sp. wls826]TKU21998.1 hypothetical protein FDW87_08490 [Citrobacter sp. wls826]TKV30111.1 hypothetical protein FDX20_27220 [Citrobacter sp. TBCS-11]
MPGISDVLNASVRDRISSYQTLAEKAIKIDGSKTGVFAALERFFFKLDFLLKYGHLPTLEDKEGNNLPPELQKLKAFLQDAEPGSSCTLQRNETERYSFSWQTGKKLAVTKEVFYPSLVGARCAYANAGRWRAQTLADDVNVELVQLALKPVTDSNNVINGKKDLLGKPIQASTVIGEFSCNEKIDNFTALPDKYLIFKAPVSPELLCKKINYAAEQINQKKYNYTLVRKCAPDLMDSRPWFDTCIKDITRAGSISVNGIELKPEMFKKIIHAICGEIPLGASGNITHINTSPLDDGTVNDILSELENENIMNGIRPILKSPQFPFAVLAGVSQSLFTQLHGEFLAGQSQFVLKMEEYIPGFTTNKLISNTMRNMFSGHLDISMNGEQELQCQVSMITLSAVNVSKSEVVINPRKTGMFFSVPTNIGTGYDQMDIENDLEQKLRGILPGMYVKVATL